MAKPNKQKTPGERICEFLAVVLDGSDNEALTARRLLHQILRQEKLSPNDLVTCIQNARDDYAEKKYTDDDAIKIRANGVEEGYRKCRAELGNRALSTQYFDSDGEPRWMEMAQFCDSNPAKSTLKASEQEFIDEVQIKLRYRPPTRPMGGFLLSIFWKLGGSFK